MKVGFIDSGGGMRGIYTSGIYDCLMDSGTKPEYCIGVSTLMRDRRKLDLLYQKGYDDGRRIEEFINKCKNFA